MNKIASTLKNIKRWQLEKSNSSFNALKRHRMRNQQTTMSQHKRTQYGRTKRKRKGQIITKATMWMKNDEQPWEKKMHTKHKRRKDQ